MPCFPLEKHEDFKGESLKASRYAVYFSRPNTRRNGKVFSRAACHGRNSVLAFKFLMQDRFSKNDSIRTVQLHQVFDTRKNLQSQGAVYDLPNSYLRPRDIGYVRRQSRQKIITSCTSYRDFDTRICTLFSFSFLPDPVLKSTTHIHY